MFEFITVRELYELYINDRDQLDGIEYVELQGWIRTNRNSGKVGFLALNDGTYFKNVQVVYLDEIIDIGVLSSWEASCINLAWLFQAVSIGINAFLVKYTAK